MARAENLYGNLPADEAQLLEEGLSWQASQWQTDLFHPDDIAKGFDPNNPLANICDLGTALLGEIYGKQSQGGRKQRMWVYESEDAYLAGPVKHKVDRHYDYLNVTNVGEVDLTRVQFPAGYFFHLVPDSQHFHFSSGANMTKRLNILRPGLAEFVANELPRLCTPTDSLVTWAEKSR